MNINILQLTIVSLLMFSHVLSFIAGVIYHKKVEEIIKNMFNGLS